MDDPVRMMEEMLLGVALIYAGGYGLYTCVASIKCAPLRLLSALGGMVLVGYMIAYMISS